MFEGIVRNVKICFLKRGLRRNAPERFSYSKEANFYVSFLKNQDTDQEILLTAIEDGAFGGLAWGADRFDTPVKFPLRDIDSWSFRTKRFYGFSQLEYAGLFDFAKSELSFLPQRLYLKEWASQRLYNYSTKFRHDRVNLLRKLVANHLAEAKKNNGLLYTSSSKSVVALLAAVYGNRIYGHPDYEEQSAQFRLILESLAATGELEKKGMHEFKLSALAVASISNYELEERRHRDSVKQNWLLFFVTVVMAIAAVVQAFSAFA